MKPEVLLRHQGRQSLQIIDRTGVDRPGRSDHACRSEACRAVLRDRRAQRREVDAQPGVRGNPSQGPVPQPEGLHRLAVAGVDLIRTIEAKRPLHRGDAVLAHVDAGLDVSGDGQSDHVRHRASADQRAAGRSGKADHLLAPANDLPVQQRGGVIAAAEVGALDRREEVADRSREVAGAHVPGPEPRMDVAHGIGHHVRRDIAVDVGQRLGSPRQGRGEEGPHVLRHFPPDRTFADVAEIADGVLDDPAGHRQRLAPVGRIERFLNGPAHFPLRSIHRSSYSRGHCAGN